MKKISFSSSLAHIVMIIILLVSFIGTGCGPSQEQIMAREKARLEREARARRVAEAKRQAEEARRQEEEARLARISATETAGDEAARRGELEKALDNYQEVLKNVKRYGEQDQRVRQAVIKVVHAMQAPPALPDDVLRYMVRGEAKVKTGGADSFEAAAKEMEQAVLAAPWFADGYYNLGIVLEKAGKFGPAIENLRLYTLAAPDPKIAAAVKAKVYELEVMKEEEEKIGALQGRWNGGQYKVTIEGRKIRIVGGYSRGPMPGQEGMANPQFYTHRGYTIELERKGRNLEGVLTDGGGESHWPTAQPCVVPAETVPVKGFIGEDGRTIELRWMHSQYHMTFADGGFWNDVTLMHCTGVALVGKEEQVLRIKKD